MLTVQSTLTERYQTTIPDTIRCVLGLQKRDRICYDVRDNGTVVLSRAEQAEEEDPALLSFLAFLERDITEHPERLTHVTHEELASIRALTAGVEDFDINAPLPPDED